MYIEHTNFAFRDSCNDPKSTALVTRVIAFVVTSGASQNIAYNYGLTVKKISSHLALLVQLLADGIVIGVEQRTRHLESQELVRPLLLL